MFLSLIFFFIIAICSICIYLHIYEDVGYLVIVKRFTIKQKFTIIKFDCTYILMYICAYTFFQFYRNSAKSSQKGSIFPTTDWLFLPLQIRIPKTWNEHSNFGCPNFQKYARHRRWKNSFAFVRGSPVVSGYSWLCQMCA